MDRQTESIVDNSNSQLGAEINNNGDGGYEHQLPTQVDMRTKQISLVEEWHSSAFIK